jgi:hypothetical protein
MGIKVELRPRKDKFGREWWYVVADFGDGHPVTKGPMAPDEAKAMAGELEEEAAKIEGAKVLTRPKEDERMNMIIGYATVGLFLALLVISMIFSASMLMR